MLSKDRLDSIRRLLLGPLYDMCKDPSKGDVTDTMLREQIKSLNGCFKNCDVNQFVQLCRLKESEYPYKSQQRLHQVVPDCFKTTSKECLPSSDLVERAFDVETTRDIDDCSICLTEMTDDDDLLENTACHHNFHRGCLMQWYNTRHQGYDRCPLCKAPLDTTLFDAADVVAEREAPSVPTLTLSEAATEANLVPVMQPTLDYWTRRTNLQANDVVPSQGSFDELGLPVPRQVRRLKDRGEWNAQRDPMTDDDIRQLFLYVNDGEQWVDAVRSVFERKPSLEPLVLREAYYVKRMQDYTNMGRGNEVRPTELLLYVQSRFNLEDNVVDDLVLQDYPTYMRLVVQALDEAT